MLKKCDISNNNSQLKCVIADAICSLSVRRCNVVFTLEKRDVVQISARDLQCNDGNMEEADDFKCVLVVYCVLESK